MMMNQQIENLENKARLLAKLGAGALTPDELRQLDALMSEDARYEDIKKRLGDAAFVGSELAAMQQIDGRKAWADMQQRIASEGGSGQRSARRIRLFPHLVKRIAAVVLLLLLGGACWYHHDYTRVTPPMITEEVELAMKESRESGHMAANVEAITAQHPSPITQEVRQLYHVDDQFAEQLAEAKRITTYQDKEYWVTLDDGTLVHLNNNSRLIYPERFGDRRDVILDGEAYFMVAKDKSRQFVVHTPQGDVKVYGTEFVVNTRKSDAEDHKDMYVVLVKGSVGFTANDGREQMLTPGQELSMVHSQLTVTDIDTAPFVAWNEGEFVFNNWSLERIMSVISRWYGLKVEFSNSSLGGRKFSGSLSRYEDIKPTIETIETVTGTTITINHQTLNIYQNK